MEIEQIEKFLAKVGYEKCYTGKDYSNFSKNGNEIVYYFAIGYLTCRDVIVKVKTNDDIELFIRKVEQYDRKNA